MKLSTTWTILKTTYDNFFEHRVLRLSAALAYYAVFSLAPLLVILISFASFFFAKSTVTEQVQNEIISTFGPKSATIIDSMMRAYKPGTSALATTLGIVTLLFGASGVFGQLQDALNTIWEVQPKPRSTVIAFLRDRFLSFSMVLGIGFLLLISMVLTTVTQALIHRFEHVLSLPPMVLQTINFSASFAVITVLFAMIFKVLPDANVRWWHVWIGSIFTALLFTIGKFLLAWYLGRESTANAYGAAGSFVLVLLWIYYASLILFLGAEFTRAYALAHGARIKPSDNAVRLTSHDRAKQGMPKEQPLENIS